MLLFLGLAFTIGLLFTLIIEGVNYYLDKLTTPGKHKWKKVNAIRYNCSKCDIQIVRSINNNKKWVLYCMSHEEEKEVPSSCEEHLMDEALG